MSIHKDSVANVGFTAGLMRIPTEMEHLWHIRQNQKTIVDNQGLLDKKLDRILRLLGEDVMGESREDDGVLARVRAASGSWVASH